MADSGASSMIMFVTALLIASLSSSLLLATWNNSLQAQEAMVRMLEADAETDAVLINDLGAVQYNAGVVDLYIQNTGTRPLEDQDVSFNIGGDIDITDRRGWLGGGVSPEWSNGRIAHFEVSTASHSSGDEVPITIVLSSPTIDGIAGTVVITHTIRLE